MVRDILADITDENKDISVFRIDVVMLPEPPFGFIEYLGKNQGCADRLQYFPAVKDFIGLVSPAM